MWDPQSTFGGYAGNVTFSTNAVSNAYTLTDLNNGS